MSKKDRHYNKELKELADELARDSMDRNEQIKSILLAKCDEFQQALDDQEQQKSIQEGMEQARKRLEQKQKRKDATKKAFMDYINNQLGGVNEND